MVICSYNRQESREPYILTSWDSIRNKYLPWMLQASCFSFSGSVLYNWKENKYIFTFFVCICMCVCVSAYMYAWYECIYMCEHRSCHIPWKSKGNLWCWSSVSTLFETGPLLLLLAAVHARPDARRPQCILMTSPPSSADIHSGDSDSVLHTCVASALCTEPSSQGKEKIQEA